MSTRTGTGTRTGTPPSTVNGTRAGAHADPRPAAGALPPPPPIPPTCPRCRQGLLWKDTRAEIRATDEHHWRWWCGNCCKRFRPTEEHLRRFS
ncbi:hypothetical protein ACIQM4_10765 [Streptomyces sp. NPDC091272]|uniref:hypothetical protein n=1 Tax=Streptomyces sp. NPDC091272 TaxID=3365981 RepID=UPI00381578D5